MTEREKECVKLLSKCAFPWGKASKAGCFVTRLARLAQQKADTTLDSAQREFLFTLRHNYRRQILLKGGVPCDCPKCKR